jgi:hypothetical protein
MKSTRRKKITAMILASTIMLNGCAMIESRSKSTPDSSEASHKREEVSGSGDFLKALGFGLLIGIIFKAAPKEAYR